LPHANESIAETRPGDDGAPVNDQTLGSDSEVTDDDDVFDEPVDPLDEAFDEALDAESEDEDHASGVPAVPRPAVEHEPTSPYLRLPWFGVAASLVVVLGLALGVALYANQSRGQPVVARSAELATPTLRPITVPTAAPTVLPALAPTPLILSVRTLPPATATVAPTTPPRPTLTATIAPTLENAAGPTDMPTALPSLLPTVEPALADEVGKAYLRFWRVQAQALLDLDTTHLSEVMEGDYLTHTVGLIEDLRHEGRAIKSEVVLNYIVTEASSDSATVMDAVKDDSVYVDIGSNDPISDPVADRLDIMYYLTRIDGAWKVVDSVSSN
jgi:hypothetical protein